MSRVLVCGSRDYRDPQTLFRVLARFNVGEPFDLLIHGGAKGADRAAADWACCFGIPVKRFEADWHTHGKAAGPVRNQRMLDEGKPDLVIAFPSGLLKDSKGTRDMVTKAVNAKVPVYLVLHGQVLLWDGVNGYPVVTE